MSPRLLLSLAFFLGACGAADQSEPVTGDEAADISPSDLADLIRSAETGDLAAANTLAVYYAATGDASEGHRWLRFAGERGDCNAVAVLYDDIVFSEVPNDELSAEIEALAHRTDCDLAAPDNAPRPNQRARAE